MNGRWTFVPVLLALVACGNPESELPLVGTLERDRIEIPAEAWETLLEIEVVEGEEVAAGQLLARQDPARLRTRVDQAAAAEQRALRRLDELRRGPRAEEIIAARARLRGAEAQLVADEKALTRAGELVERALLSDADLDEARARRDLSVASRDDAAATLEELVTGTTAEELDQAQASLDEARALLADQSLALDRLQLRAPVAGLVDSIPYKQGDRPSAGATVMVLLAGAAPHARVYVPEPLRASVHVGMEARVLVDGVQAPFAGRVSAVASEASFTPYFSLTERDRSRLAYVAEIDLVEAGAAELPTGLPVEVSFPGLEREAAP